MLIKFNLGHDQEAKSLYIYQFEFWARDPLDSGIRENNVLIDLRKAGHAVPTPFLVRVNCSVTIVAAQSLQLGAVFDNFQFYLSLFFRSCFHCYYCCSVFFSHFFLQNGRVNHFSEM